MYPLFESIACINGQVRLLQLHQERIDRSLYELYSQKNDSIRLNEIISVNTLPSVGKYKIKIKYNTKNFEYSLTPYRQAPGKSFSIQHNNEISYAYKWTNRYMFKDSNAKNKSIWVKNGMITDSDYSNLAFLKDGLWYTPAKPLLIGVMRTYLLSAGLLAEENIHIDMIGQYSKFKCINALNTLSEAIEYSIDKIKI